MKPIISNLQVSLDGGKVVLRKGQVVPPEVVSKYRAKLEAVGILPRGKVQVPDAPLTTGGGFNEHGEQEQPELSTSKKTKEK